MLPPTGITWLLSDEVMNMRQAIWDMRFKELAHIRVQPPRRAYVSHTHPNTALRDWVAHQKALRALGARRASPNHIEGLHNHPRA